MTTCPASRRAAAPLATGLRGLALAPALLALALVAQPLAAQPVITAAREVTQILDAAGIGGGATFGLPSAVAVADDGTVYAFSEQPGGVFEITSGGAVTRIIDASGDGLGNGLGDPRELCLDAAGNVYVAGWYSSNVFKVEPDGTISEIIDTTGDGVHELLRASHLDVHEATGDVFVVGAQSNNVFRIEPDGTITELMDSTAGGTGQFLSGKDIAVNSAGEVFVTGGGSNRVRRIAPDGAIDWVLDETGDGLGNIAIGVGPLEIDDDDNVFVYASTTGNVFRVTPGGVITEVFDKVAFGNPGIFFYEMAVSGAGFVYLSSTDNSSVWEITPGGDVTRVIKATGDDQGHGLDNGYGLAAGDDGHVYVSGRFSDNVFDVDVNGWVDQGGGKTGSQGTPQLTGSGSLGATSPNAVALTSAHPDSVATLVLGFDLLNTWFKQATLIPSPQFLVSVPTDGSGAVSVPFVMPAAVPPGVDVFFQCWTQDPTTTVGLSASNGLRGRTP